MKYFSTRDKSLKKNFQEIVMQGLSSDGGLFLPETWPVINLNNLKSLNYDELAFEIIHPFCGDSVDQEELRNIINKTYKNFHHPNTAPLVNLDDYQHVLELFYGPTFSFKDYALQLLGNLFEYFLNKSKEKITIIGATSGDTGSAAIDACKLKKNINIFIIHPHKKISEVQRRQMTTVIEPNVYNIAVDGNFDDCQKIIKKLFIDSELLGATNLTAINSINWARIIAQSVYYFWSYFKLNDSSIPVNYIVPSGNFGNVYAGHVAQKMGLPIEMLYVVTNENDILHRTITNGEMLIKNVKTTYSPSMDIQVSSNFERQLFESLNNDSSKLISIMNTFINNKTYQLEQDVVNDLSNKYKSYSVNNQEILETIKLYYNRYNYLSDPHTATGLHILKNISNEKSHFISLACAHPAKFESAIKDSIEQLPNYPDSLKNIFEKDEKFTILDNDTNKIKEYILNKI